MKNEKFEEIVKELSLAKEEWIILSDIDSIILRDGIGIYPNWRHLRFLISDNEIFIQHGKSTQYGARLSQFFDMSYDGGSIVFNNGNIVLPDIADGIFREPRKGDIIRIGCGDNPCVEEVMIMNMASGMNGLFLDVSPSIRNNGQQCRLSFYDPMMYDKKTCIHGTEEEGIYMKFIPNSGKTHRKYGVFQEKINIRDIDEINLKLKTNKTYRLK